MKDSAAENKLLAENRIFTVAADTKVRIIEIQNDKYVHLRIASGPHTGEDGWVSRSWVRYGPRTRRTATNSVLDALEARFGPRLPTAPRVRERRLFV